MTVLFFLSGAAGLIFEMVWFHRCGLVFGNSVWSASIVLSSFMGGLAFGNAAVGRFGARAGTLRTYAALEVVVAVAGLALTYALPALTPAFVAFVGPITPLWFVNVIRLAMAFGVLLVPSTAMGATLPVVVGAAVRARRDFSRALGRLYGWNTLGAVVGVLAAEVVLIDRVGVVGTAWVAATLDLGVAAGALGLAHTRSTSDGDRIAIGSTSGDDRVAIGSTSGGDRVAIGSTSDGNQILVGRRAALLAAAFLAGAVLLVLEVVWFRFLTMYVLATTLAASVMLASVLGAIAFGGLVARRLFAGDAPEEYAPAVAVTAGCATAASYVVFQWVTHGTQVGEWNRVLWFAFALTAPTAFLSGTLFTLLGAAIGRASAAPTRSTALLALSNTAGATCGPLVAAFVMLPALGMERSVFAAAAIYGVIAILALFGLGRGVAVRTRSPLVAICAIALMMVLALFPSGLMRERYFIRSAQAYAGDGSDIVAIREGPSETIFLMQQKWLGRPVYSRLVTNGFSMTGTAMPGMRYMRYFAYWPMLLHQAPLRRALVICYGVGVTAAAVLDLPAIESVDVVELSRDIVAMSDVLYAADRHPLHDPRVRLHVEDGRYFLEASRDRFDLITGEPPPPRTPGAVNIYTREYFNLIHDRLADGGIATYWLPVARPDPGTDVHTIIRAFCDVFDDCSMWNATPFDFMLAGTRHLAGPVTAASFAEAWQSPALASRLREVGFEQPAQIGATFLGDAAYLHALTANTPPLSDDFPQRLRPVPARPSLSDPRYRSEPAVMDLYQTVIDPARAQRAFAASDFVHRLWPPPLVHETLPFFGQQRILNRVLLEGGGPLRHIEDLHALLTTTTLRTLPLWLLGSDEVKQRIAEDSSERTGATEYVRALRALTARDYLRAAAHFSEAERRGLEAPALRPLLVYSLCLAGDRESALRLSRGTAARDADERHFWDWMRATLGV